MKNNKSVTRQKQKGFTLLEVLMALAIFAICSATLLLSDGQSVRQVAQIKNKMMASILAEEALNKIYIMKEWPDNGITGTVKTLDQRKWFVQREVMPWKDNHLKKVNIHVYTGDRPEKSEKVYQLTGITGNFRHE